MINPWHLITIYPPPELVSHIENKKRIRVFVDLKNVMIGLFVPDIQEEILDKFRRGITDSSIFQACVGYAAHWKRRAKARGLNCEIYFTTDVGKSIYHSEINRNYKKSRQVSDMNKYSLNDKTKEIRDTNFELCEKVLNRVDDIYFFNLKYLESDFLPHYLIHHVLDKREDTLNVICSGDKDLLQTLTDDNIVMIYRRQRNNYLINKELALYQYYKRSIKDKSELEGYKFEDLVPMMSVIGDPEDDVPGVKGIGKKRALSMFKDRALVEGLIGGISEVRERILENNGNFFLEDRIPLKKLDKIWSKAFIKNETVTDAFRLISFEALINWMVNSGRQSKKEWVNYINKVLKKDGYKPIKDFDVFMEAFNKLTDIVLEPKDIKPLFD